ncbi:MAG: hypothetical protein V2A62_04890 [Candidatus Woesearchaeota archaeon]
MGISSWFGKGAAASGAGGKVAEKAAATGIGKALAPALGKAASKVGGAVSAGGSAAQGALWGAGATVGEGVMNLLKQQSFLLFLVGLVHFFFLRTNTGAINYFTLLMFLFGAYVFFTFLEEKKMIEKKIGGWIVIFAFMVWYFIYGSTLSNLTYFGIITGAIILILGIATKGEGFKAAAWAFVPIIFLFLDMGLLALLFGGIELRLTTIINNLIQYMPWWSLLGLFCFPTEEKSKLSTFMEVVRVVGIMYIVIVCVGSAVPAFGNESILPTPETLANAQKQATEKFSGENPFVSNMICIFDGRSDVAQCVKERQDLAEDEFYCKNVEEIDKGTPQFDQCLKDRKDKREKDLIQVTGVNDPTIKMPTRAELVTDKFFPRESTIYSTDNYQIQYPVEVKITNPREQQFMVEVNCNFTETKSNPKSFLGKISGGDRINYLEAGTAGDNKFYVDQATQSKLIYCTYPGEPKLNGSYKLTFTAELTGLNTTSRLARVFIGTKSEQWKKDWISSNKIFDAHFPNKVYTSVGPEDFARLNFAFGHSGSYPIIESGKTILLQSMIENVGPGEITKVWQYKINLDGFLPDPADSKCLNGDVAPSSKKLKKDIYLPGCIIQSLPLEFTNPEMYIYREFEAELKYDYKIKKEESIRVTLVS